MQTSTNELFAFENRPWGSFAVIDECPGYKVKRLSVFPGKRLSSQMHHHRAEHWVVVAGTALVTVNGVETVLEVNQSIFIPAKSQHRLENTSSDELVLIEVQIGNYLGEDDIVRFDDDFGRA